MAANDKFYIGSVHRTNGRLLEPSTFSFTVERDDESERGHTFFVSLTLRNDVIVVTLTHGQNVLDTAFVKALAIIEFSKAHGLSQEQAESVLGYILVAAANLLAEVKIDEDRHSVIGYMDCAEQGLREMREVLEKVGG